MKRSRRGWLARLLRAVAHALRALALVVVALLLVFEEWGWEPLQRALARLGRLPVLRQIEAGITRLPPKLALLVFLLPSLLLVPVKLLALWLIARGHSLLGVLVIVAAKLGGTALVARLFVLTRAALMKMPWFARLYERWTTWKDALLARVRASWAWRFGRALKRLLRRRWSRGCSR